MRIKETINSLFEADFYDVHSKVMHILDMYGLTRESFMSKTKNADKHINELVKVLTEASSDEDKDSAIRTFCSVLRDSGYHNTIVDKIESDLIDEF